MPELTLIGAVQNLENQWNTTKTQTDTAIADARQAVQQSMVALDTLLQTKLAEIQAASIAVDGKVTELKNLIGV